MRCAVHPDCFRRTPANPHYSPRPPGGHIVTRQAGAGRRMIADPSVHCGLRCRSSASCRVLPPTLPFRVPRKGRRSFPTLHSALSILHSNSFAPSPHRPLRCAGDCARSIACMYQPQGAVAAGPAPREARGSCSLSQALRLLSILDSQVSRPLRYRRSGALRHCRRHLKSPGRRAGRTAAPALL